MYNQYLKKKIYAYSKSPSEAQRVSPDLFFRFETVFISNLYRPKTDQDTERIQNDVIDVERSAPRDELFISVTDISDII